jgi:hypothetical protein
MPAESNRFTQEWTALLAQPDPEPSTLAAKVEEAGMPDVESYHDLVARLSRAPLPYPLRGRQLPPGSKVQVMAWAYQLIEKQKASHRAWSKRQAKGPFLPSRPTTTKPTPKQKRERQRRYTAKYRAKVRKQLEGIRRWDAPTSGEMLKRRRRRRRRRR